jgi:tRNA(Ile2) C34 agmatinyltransferase TiaS
MPPNDKPLRHRLQNANASTLAELLRMKAIKRIKQTSEKRAVEAVKNPVRKRVRGSVFDDDDDEEGE